MRKAQLSADCYNNARNPAHAPAACNPNAYTITLESRTLVNGNWEWIWSVQNPNPGNGNNGTAQDLSHWGMQFGSCFASGHLLLAPLIAADGINLDKFYSCLSIDPSQSCMTTPVLKFDFGTSGSAKSYYNLVVNQDYTWRLVPGIINPVQQYRLLHI